MKTNKNKMEVTSLRVLEKKNHQMQNTQENLFSMLNYAKLIKLQELIQRQMWIGKLFLTNSIMFRRGVGGSSPIGLLT